MNCCNGSYFYHIEICLTRSAKGLEQFTNQMLETIERAAVQHGQENQSQISSLTENNAPVNQTSQTAENETNNHREDSTSSFSNYTYTNSNNNPPNSNYTSNS